MSEGIPFKEISLNGKPISKCEMILECNKGSYRLYIDKDIKRHQFSALAIEFVSCLAEDKKTSIWDSSSLEVQQLFSMIAYYDGVRHLEFNRESDEMAGYIYYPNMQGLVEMMQKVREIELEVCIGCDRY